MRLIIIACLTALLLPVLGIMGYNYYVDPYQYYRKWSGAEPIFSTDGRRQNPGLIKHYDFDTPIIGTSRSQNFTPEMFEGSGWQPIKLTASGSGSYVHARTLRQALESGKVERAIIELAPTAYQFGATYTRQGKTLPEFLYQPTVETPFLYLLSIDLLKKSRRIMAGKDRSSSLGEINVWQHRYQDAFGKNRYLADISFDCRPLDDIPPSWRGTYPLMDEALEANLESVLQDHADIEFLGFLPPYPVSWFGKVSEPHRRMRFGFRQRVYELAARHPNLRLFDFELVQGIVDDPARYKDFNHYDQATNAMMARSFIDGEWEVSGDDPTEGNRRLKQLTDAFDWHQWTSCDRGKATPDIISSRSEG